MVTPKGTDVAKDLLTKFKVLKDVPKDVQEDFKQKENERSCSFHLDNGKVDALFTVKNCTTYESVENDKVFDDFDEFEEYVFKFFAGEEGEQNADELEEEKSGEEDDKKSAKGGKEKEEE